MTIPTLFHFNFILLFTTLIPSNQTQLWRMKWKSYLSLFQNFIFGFFFLISKTLASSLDMECNNKKQERD